jgi:hypothetical protein
MTPPADIPLPIGFGYVPNAIPANATGTTEPISAGALPSPVGDFEPEAGDVAAHRGVNQATEVASDTNPFNLYAYMAFGGNPQPTYDVSMTQVVADGETPLVFEMKDVEAGDDGWRRGSHGFNLKTDDGIEFLSGLADVPAGDYMWTLNARNEVSDQHLMRSWLLTVNQLMYAAITTNPDATTSGAESDAEGDDWADFVSSEFDPLMELTAAMVVGGALAELDLATGLAPGADPPTPGAGMISGEIMEAAAEDDPDDVDVFWVGRLTPDSMLHVKVKGTEEASAGQFNDVDVTLHRHVMGKMEQTAEDASEMSSMEGYDEYMMLNSGGYYLKVTGDGPYTLSWMFTE